MKKACFLLAGLAVVFFASAQAGEIRVPNRLATAKVGEWASYSLPSGYIQKQSVISRTGEGPSASVVVRIENIYQGQLVNSHEIVKEAGDPYHMPEIPTNDGSVKFSRKTITVKGKPIDTMVIEMEEEDEGDDDDDEEVKWYISAEIPVFGIVRQEMDDDIVYDLVDYGTN